MRLPRRTAAAVAARSRTARSSSRPVCVTEPLEVRRLLAAVVDDFNDGTDNNWTHYEPLAQFGAPGTYTLENGTYRLQAAESPAPEQAGPGRAGSVRDNVERSDFIASIDIVDWDNNLNQAFGLLGRITEPGLGTTKGYALSYATNGDLALPLLTAELPDALDPAVDIFLDPARDYRLVFEGHGNTLTGRLIDIETGEIVAGTRAIDDTYSTGQFGVFVYDNSRAANSVADATFDNFMVDDAPPDPTVAYWRFEEGSVDQEFQPPTDPAGPDSGLARDSFGGDDALRTYSAETNPTYSGEVPADKVTVTGENNRRSLSFTPGAEDGGEDLYTAQPGTLNPHAFNQWTVEASFNVDTVEKWQGIVGKDGKPTPSALAPLQLKVRDDNDLLQIEIIDAAGNEKQVSSLAPIEPGVWYNAAAVSDGTTMKLYLDDTRDEAGYVLQGTVDVAGGLFPVESGWAVGRGFFGGNPADWTDGRIDEVRISDAALDPGKFLFARSTIIIDTPTTITAVFVNGPGLTGGTPSANQAAFRTMAGIDPTFGYPVPAGTNQLKSIPWINGINQVAIRFNQPVQVDQNDLVVRGSATATYTPTNFSYDPATNTAVWTLPAAVTNDKLRLVVDDTAVTGGFGFDGDWQNGNAAESFPSGDGTTGGDFDFRINVLGGDATQDGIVNALDLSQIRQKLNKTATAPGTGGGAYSVFADVTADGQINALDLSAARQRLNRRLPTTDPTATSLLLE